METEEKKDVIIEVPVMKIKATSEPIVKQEDKDDGSNSVSI